VSSKIQEEQTLPSEPVVWSETDRRMMDRALTLAKQGTGLVSPGPLVGCVLADSAGEVVGEGCYVYEQIKHAETHAIEQAREKARGATAYISLEPHAHHGRTPPCTDALIQAGVTRVVAPIEDPNPAVSGKGFAHLRARGIAVDHGLLAEAAARVNEQYIHFMRTKRPFVHLKVAVSLDGKIATRTGDSRWITGAESRARVHELRREYDAILVGVGTAIADDPLLTDRSGKPRRRPLLRVVLDERLQLPIESQLVRTAPEAPLAIITSAGAKASVIAALEEKGAQVMGDYSGGRDLRVMLDELGRREIQSVLVEGGANVASKFLAAGLVDKVTFFIAPMIIGGRSAPSAIGDPGADTIADAWRLRNVEIHRHGNDLEVTGYPDDTNRNRADT
jgi:diaminohydroxyphosphoribosylaminopyrimidine deaminase/5-amino-6-(5-phosphoribosylamino)uracil reductase